MASVPTEDERTQVLNAYKAKVMEHREMESRVKNMRENVKTLVKEFNKTEDDLKALQSVGQIIGEVLRQLDEDRFIVKASSGPRYVVGCRAKVDKSKLKSGTRVALDMTTLTIMRYLPREVDPTVYHMLNEDAGNVSFSSIGGLNDQIRELREVIELPLTNPELFLRVGIKPPKGVLLYGPPGTGKTLLARALACNINATFLKVVASAIVDKYIGESARVIREMFGYARDHQPCVIFMDEIDAIGGSRYSEGTSADREIQRTLMELLNQLDGFDALGQVKMVMATNRPDILDPALLRPGRLDRKIEIPLPNEASRMDILKIHSGPITKKGEIDYESIVKLTDGFNGADMRNVCTEAGMFAIRADREYVVEEDFMKAARKLAETKKLESKMDYSKGIAQATPDLRVAAGRDDGSRIPRVFAEPARKNTEEQARGMQRTTRPIILLLDSSNGMLDGEDELLDFAMERTQLSRNELLAAAAFGDVPVVVEGSDSARKDYGEKLALAEETLETKAEEAAQQTLTRYREVSGHLYAFLVFEVDGVALPRVELELFHGLGYQGNPVHRVVRGGWIQTGDVAGNGRGDGPCRSLYGLEFPDESFAVSHNAAGILSMANTGPHTNGSQFFITLAPQPWLDRRKVAFGRVVSGWRTVMTIGGLETRQERPCVPCTIVDSGRLQ
ncbi:Cyclophilin-like domain [Phytophthora cactorum]|nr:Cyclophilin-like domain [Phytophthora cactorum]